MNTAINNTPTFFYATRPTGRLREQVTSQGTNQAYGLPTPLFQQDEDFRVVIYRPETEIREQVTSQGASEGPSQGASEGLSQGPVEKILNLCRKPEKLAVMCEAMGFTNRTKFRENYIVPLINDGYLEMTIPAKPTSQNQRYRLTPKGVYLLSKYDEVRDDK